MKTAALSFSLASIIASAALAGPEWTETGDAGDGLPNAQDPLGMGPLAGIKGDLDGPIPRGLGDFEDVYRIFIKDFTNFSAILTTNASGNPTFDTQLWLFNEFGQGVLGNDDNSITGGSGLSAFFRTSTDGSGSEILNDGIYYLAISGAGNIPLDMFGNPIFNFTNVGEVSGPDGSLNPLAGWSGKGDFGEYTINLTGASFLPAPSAAGLALIAGITAARRRRAS